jgi:hypothetical protein
VVNPRGSLMELKTRREEKEITVQVWRHVSPDPVSQEDPAASHMWPRNCRRIRNWERQG